MRSEQIDFSDFAALQDTQYIYNTGGEYVRAADRDNEWYIWQNNEGFIATTDLGNTYDNDPSGLRDFDPGHLVVQPPDSFEIGAGDFTIEAWIWLDDEPWDWNTIMSQRLDEYTELSFQLQYYDQQLRVTFNDGQVTHLLSLTGAQNTTDPEAYAQSVHASYPTMSVSPSAWHHVAVVRSSGTITSYLDGAATGSVSDSTDVQYSDESIYIGAANDGGVNYAVEDAFIGYMMDVRLTTQALYVEDFDPRYAIENTNPGVLLGDPHVTTFAGYKYTL